MGNALVLPLLFFLATYVDPDVTGPIIAMAAVGRVREDAFVKSLQTEHQAPNDRVLWLSKEPFKSNLVMNYDVAEGDILPEAWKNNFGLVVADYVVHAANPVWLLKWCMDALVVGGSMVMLDKRKVYVRVRKEA